ncbi:MAG: radical SAM protein [Oscillospiraceae bacterium]|nr:radical SAM protein [Oscillospiraceae bacterium]
MLSYTDCKLCPRACGADRTAGKRGFCQMPAQAHAAAAILHYGEEPAIAAFGGAGAVFFSGCTLRCAYCQNYAVSAEGFGFPVDSGKLREIFLKLIEDGADCIDLVTPTQFLPDILPALTPKLPVPVVYNCGGYESLETIRALEGYIDIYLPDFKYSDAALAKRLSAAEDYPEVAEAAIREMQRQVGAPVFDGERLTRGVLIRHLVLPGCTDNSLGVLDRLSAMFRPGEVLLSLMSQYTPMGALANTPPFDRGVTEEEYAAVLSWAELCGLRDGFRQDASAAGREYVPRFDGSGVIF